MKAMKRREWQVKVFHYNATQKSLMSEKNGEQRALFNDTMGTRLYLGSKANKLLRCRFCFECEVLNEIMVKSLTWSRMLLFSA